MYGDKVELFENCYTNAFLQIAGRWSSLLFHLTTLERGKLSTGNWTEQRLPWILGIPTC